MKADEIRRRFLDYFREQDHRVVDSDPLLPSDPDLLFTIAGMVPFKPYFLGEETPPHPRLTSSQKCLRTTDIEEVGRTDRHLTFFEMLGNFSFGDYFKAGAIEFGWEFLTERLDVDPDRLWITVFQGEEELPRDEESFDLWREAVGVPAERILELGSKENFWAMGETGPCGPCSEIHYDRESVDGDPGSVREAILSGDDRMVELWNLVFMQYNRSGSGDLEPLPDPCIDTGMGLERVASVLQGVPGPFETDLFQPLMESIRSRAELDGTDLAPRQRASLRVVADHLRSVCFLLAEGLVPGNEGRGYVLRRLIRRAVLRGRDLDIRDVFLQDLVSTVQEVMGEAYPELHEQEDLIRQRLKNEEEQFLRTIDRGLSELEQRIERLKEEDRETMPGEEVFELYETHGFPVEMTRDLLREEGLDFDEGEVEEARERHRRESSSLEEKTDKIFDGIKLMALAEDETEFTGYDRLTDEAEVVGLFDEEGESVEELPPEAQGVVVLDRTPFYPEGGGQVGDRGSINGFEVKDTQQRQGLILHEGTATAGIKLGDTVEAEVKREHRRPTMRHHTATHLLQAALRREVGDEVMQDGSLVDPDHLRFDFTLTRGLTDDELKDVEEQVNEWIYDELPVRAEEMSRREADERGALAFFGEHYGEEVRVVEMGDVSVELCGGTHLDNTGELGLFTITNETAVSAGVRRIEARAGERAYQQLSRLRDQLEKITKQAGVQSPRELEDRLRSMRETIDEYEDRIEQLRHQQSSTGAEELLDRARKVGPAQVLLEEFDNFDQDALKQTLDRVKQRLDEGVVLFINRSDGAVQLLLGVTDGLTDVVDAGEWIRDLGDVIGGGGGGRSDFAQAGGSRVDRIDDLRQMFEDRLESVLGSAAGD